MFWHPYLLSFFTSSAFILSFCSTLDCNFAFLSIPYEIAGSPEQTQNDDGQGIGLFTYEAISVRETPNAVMNVGLQMQQGLARRKCMGFRSAKVMESGRINKRKYYASFAGGDPTLSLIRTCALFSIFGIFSAAVIAWRSMLRDEIEPHDYGPRMTYREVKKSTLRTIVFLILLLFCLIMEGIKFRFTRIQICTKEHTVEVFVNQTVSTLQTIAKAGSCSPSRGMGLSITAFVCLCFAFILSLVN